MGYRQVTCPICEQRVETSTFRNQPEKIAIHTRRDGSGQQCPGTGLPVNNNEEKPDH